MLDNNRVTKILNGYIGCAIWSEMDDNDRPLDENYSAVDILTEDKVAMREDCERFYTENQSDLENFADAAEYWGKCLERRSNGWELAGYCFWLSRNGHGAGFFDRFMVSAGDSEELEELCERLQTASERFGGAHLLPSDQTDTLYYFNG